MPLTKSKFREKCLKKLANTKQERKYYRDSLLNKALLREIQSKKRKNILFYYPLPNEADIRKTLQKLRKKHTVYLPFMVGKSFKMVPFRLPLKKKKFGIFEAGNTLRDIKKIDIAIVPTVGVDGNLRRIGFGKGMYDRFFAKLKKRPYTIFIQPKLCYTNEKICDEYDIAGDVLITPTKKITRK
ncbi:MAG: 5-formyltetrahydrofolate cyclo-ligase [Epsilonproteobacteria bacterium]|nr:5-formyltetrahydrofolate cyclo-ligase [Campylobacterota bacterium]